MSLHEPTPHDFDQPKRPYSIDLSLELERQLDNESLPPTPAALARPQSMDQHVLASLVRQLRMNVEEVSKDRDMLREQVAKLESDKKGAEDMLLQFSTRCAQMEEELEVTKTKMKEDEHSINMLRTKVEESRRGLMRLQTENRRMTQVNSMSVDTSRTGLTAFATPLSSKRASFTPLTGASRTNAHKRISSISDSGFLSSLGVSDNNSVSPNPNAQTDNLADPSSSGHPPVTSRRFSGIFGRTSPPGSLDLPPKDPLVEEMEALRREMKAVRAELEDTRHELSEANEAREASETCVKALRDFIAETQSSGTQPESVKLPPMPTMTTGEEADTRKSASGWGAFRMWKMEPVVHPDPNEAPPPVGTRRMWKLDTTVKPTSSGPGSASTSPSSRATPIAAPFTTKIGGFFTSRSSISSTTSSNRPAPQSLHLQPSYNDSDTSSIQESVVEPISPASEVPGTHVMVRSTSASSSTEFGLPEHVKTLQEPVAPAESILPTPKS